MRRRLRLPLLVGAVPVLVVGLLGAEVVRVTTRSFLSGPDAPSPAYAVPGPDPLRLVVLGDSTGAGVGAADTASTVGAQLARLLGDRLGRGIDVTGVAASGARVADLAEQLPAALAVQPDLAVVLVGANDATHLTGLGSVRSGLADVVRRLRAAGVEVVVGTCPDLGAARAFPQPLRALAAWRGRAVARAERAAVLAAGGHVVDLAAETGPAFRADPAGTLASDQFHPSARGYALWARSLAAGFRTGER